MSRKLGILWQLSLWSRPLAAASWLQQMSRRARQ